MLQNVTVHALPTLRLTFPLRTSISPSMADTREDLPDPTCPTTPTSCPSPMRNLMLPEIIKTEEMGKVDVAYAYSNF